VGQDTAEKEHDAFLLRQKAALSTEVKQTLDSWVRYEAQAREAEQRELVKSVIDKVLAGLQDAKTQKDILATAVSDIEGRCLACFARIGLMRPAHDSSGQGQEDLDLARRFEVLDVQLKPCARKPLLHFTRASVHPFKINTSAGRTTVPSLCRPGTCTRCLLPDQRKGSNTHCCSSKPKKPVPIRPCRNMSSANEKAKASARRRRKYCRAEEHEHQPDKQSHPHLAACSQSGPADGRRRRT
jgi:hypothetical protein